MVRLSFVLAALLCLGVPMTARVSAADPANAKNKHVLELRTVTLKNDAAVEAFDKYASEALIPALNRLGIQPVGAFKMTAEQPAPAAGAPKPDASIVQLPKVLLLLPGKDVETIAMANERVAADKQYQAAASEYLKTPSDKPVIDRISSELLISFDSWPQVKVPKQKTENKKRIFELRTYESPTEQLGHLKVEMFNSGEVPIFLACNIQPVFMGQAVIGSVMPNLTYMTCYDDTAELTAAWARFREHPDWKVLKDVPKYQGTVTNIHKSNWEPTSYSQL